MKGYIDDNMHLWFYNPIFAPILSYHTSHCIFYLWSNYDSHWYLLLLTMIVPSTGAPSFKPTPVPTGKPSTATPTGQPTSNPTSPSGILRYTHVMKTVCTVLWRMSSQTHMHTHADIHTHTNTHTHTCSHHDVFSIRMEPFRHPFHPPRNPSPNFTRVIFISSFPFLSLTFCLYMYRVTYTV